MSLLPRVPHVGRPHIDQRHETLLSRIIHRIEGQRLARRADQNTLSNSKSEHFCSDSGRRQEQPNHWRHNRPEKGKSMRTAQASLRIDPTASQTACPECGNEMRLVSISPDKPGYDLRIFECVDCDQTVTNSVQI